MLPTNCSIPASEKSIFTQMIEPKIRAHGKVHVLNSLMYLTNNYMILYTLNTLAKLTRQGYVIHIIHWDMNTLANPYFKRLFASNHSDLSQTKFIEEREKDLVKILLALGARKNSFHLYKSTDLWSRLVKIREPALFLQYYQVLAELSPKDFTQQASHLIQMSMDMFLTNYLRLLEPDNISQPVDILLFSERKRAAYEDTRRIMIKEGFSREGRTAFLEVNELPALLFNDFVPEWNMDLDTVIDIVSKAPLDEEKIPLTLQFLANDELKELTIISADGSPVEQPAETAIAKLKRMPTSKWRLVLAHNIFKYLQTMKEKISMEKEMPTTLDVKTASASINIGKILKSKISLDILRLADGTHTMSDIAKTLHKQLSNISTYAHELKEQGLIIIDAKGVPKRTIRSIQLHLDFI